MASWQDVQAAATALPEVVEATSYGRPSWVVRRRTFAWERPLGRKDLADLGLAAQPGPVLGLRVADPGVAQALVATDRACFTIPHFRDFPAVLVRLDDLDPVELDELVVDAWLAMAPARLAERWLNPAPGEPPRRRPPGT